MRTSAFEMLSENVVVAWEREGMLQCRDRRRLVDDLADFFAEKLDDPRLGSALLDHLLDSDAVEDVFATAEELVKHVRDGAATVDVQSSTTSPPQASAIAEQGAQLVRLVIEKTRREGTARLLRGYQDPDGVGFDPRPAPADSLETLSFPGGRTLPPSLREWLSFDAQWLDWSLQLRPRTVGEWLAQEYGLESTRNRFDVVARRLSGMAYPLPLGSEQRACLYVGEPDSEGEYPVLFSDIGEGHFCIGIAYPGFDVYLAERADLIQAHTDELYWLGALAKDPRYEARMSQHHRHCFAGIDVPLGRCWYPGVRISDR